MHNVLIKTLNEVIYIPDAQIHMITDFGQNYNAGSLASLPALFSVATQGRSQLHINQYGPVAAFTIEEAAYAARFAYGNILPAAIYYPGSNPFGFVHGLLLVVDPTVGEKDGLNNRQPLAFRLSSGIFGVAPDNGLVTRLADDIQELVVIDQDRIDQYTGLGSRVNRIWDCRDTFGPALALVLATQCLDRVGYPIDAGNIKKLALPEFRTDGEYYFAAISGTDHNGNITLDADIFGFNNPKYIEALDVYQGDIPLGRYYFQGSYVSYSRLTGDGLSLVCLSNPFLHPGARIELAASSKNLISSLKRKNPGLNLVPGAELRIKPAYQGLPNPDFNILRKGVSI